MNNAFLDEVRMMLTDEERDLTDEQRTARDIIVSVHDDYRNRHAAAPDAKEIEAKLQSALSYLDANSDDALTSACRRSLQKAINAHQNRHDL